MIPCISIIMPVYNGEKYLREAIESLLSQTFTDFELIIINDASQDGSEDIILSYKDHRIVYMKNEENLGVAKTLNRGIAVAQAEYIARHDSDDVSLPTRFEKQVQIMDVNPTIGLCGTWAQTLRMTAGEKSEKGAVLDVISQPEKIKVNLLFGNNFVHSSVLFRKSSLLNFPNPYNPEFSFAEDYDLWVRISRNWKVINIPEVLILYRLHDLQISNQKIEQQKEQAWLIQKKQIEALGIQLSLDEELIHRYLAGFIWFDNNPVQVIAGGHYFIKLKKANKKYKVYDAIALRQVLWEKWSVLEASHVYSVKIACLTIWLAIELGQFNLGLLKRLTKNVLKRLYKRVSL